jgi:hypothetical protein
MPPWMAGHPHLSSRLLAWQNAYRHRRRRLLLAAISIAAGLAVVAVLAPAGPILDWFGRHWAVAFVIATSVFMLSTAHRRQHALMAAATSWLASLPSGSPAWARVAAGTAGRLAGIVALIALLALVGVIDRADFSRLAVATAAGALVGLLAGWRLHRAGIGAPGFHYAIVRRPRRRWASAPSLSPLAHWPAAQGRIFSRPKRTAPALIMAMMAIPMGSPGQIALAVAGVCMALFGVFSLTAAAVRVAFEAARWLAPTTVGKLRFTVALTWRVMLTQVVALTVLIFLTSAVYLHGALAIGAPIAAVYLGVSLATVILTAFWACRRAGLGATGRGA